MNPLINGINYAWASITVMLFGVPVIGIVAIDYKEKQNKTNNYGAGTEPTSRGYGASEYEASIELYTDTLKAIIAAAPQRRITKIPMFDITVTFGGEGVIPTTDKLRACEFLEDVMDSKQGDTKITVKLPLIIAGLNR